MRVSNWNPAAGDTQIMKASMERLQAAAEVIAQGARANVPIGKSRPKYLNGKDYTAREAGALRASIRVVRLHGDTRRNVRVYAGSKKVYYARFVEMGTYKMRARSFLRTAVNQSKGAIRSILLNGV